MSKQSERDFFLRQEKDPDMRSNNINFVGIISVSPFAYFLLLIALHTQKGKKKQNHYWLQLPGSNDKQPLSGETLMTRQVAQQSRKHPALTGGLAPTLTTLRNTIIKLRPCENLRVARRLNILSYSVVTV